MGPLSQVVGALLDRETEQPHFGEVRGQDHVERAVDHGLVRVEDRIDQGDAGVEVARRVGQGSEVLREAASAEGEPGSEVGRRCVLLERGDHHVRGCDGDFF
jgi:hypothetical protein